VADVQDGDVGADHPTAARLPLRIGPHEAPTADAEVEPVALDLLDPVQRERELADLLGIGHPDLPRLLCGGADDGGAAAASAADQGFHAPIFVAMGAGRQSLDTLADRPPCFVARTAGEPQWSINRVGRRTRV